MRGRSGRRGAWLLSEKAERGQGRPALFCCRKKFCTNFKKMLTDVIFPDIINIVLMRSIRNGKVRYAAVAHLVERHLAKVEVASSSLVTCSRNENGTADGRPGFVSGFRSSFLCSGQLNCPSAKVLPPAKHLCAAHAAAPAIGTVQPSAPSFAPGKRAAPPGRRLSAPPCRRAGRGSFPE